MPSLEAAPSRRRAPRGITLMEVLIAMFVMTVGLLGLAAMIPIGRWQMTEAARLDRSANLGRSTFRDLQIRNVLSPENWLYCTPAGGTQFAVVGPNGQFVVPPGGSIDDLPPFVPLVLDPLLIAQNFETAGQLEAVSWFPYRAPNATYTGLENANPVQLPRITVKRVVGSDIPLTNLLAFLDPALGGSTQLGPRMSLSPAVSERVFRSEDDLNFMVPADKALRPTQLFSGVDGLAGLTDKAPGVRQSVGDFSWMAVVQPNIEEAVGINMTNLPTQPRFINAAKVRNLVVYFVVFHKRMVQDVTRMTQEDVYRHGERRALIFFNADSGLPYGGSDATIEISGPSNREEAAQALHLRGGDVILVTGRAPYYGVSPSRSVTRAHWYHVLSVADDVFQNGSGRWSRRVRLVGRNWPLVEPSLSSISSVIPSGYATLLHGAIGVYEKPITLDGTSLWSN